MSDDILERIAAHYDALSGGHIDVPEWGFCIYWAPVTVKDKSDIIRRAGNDPFKQALWTVLLKAQSASGERLFTLEHRRTLETAAHADTIERISQAIHHGTQDPDLGN